MAAVALITLMILLEYLAFMLLVGKARVQGNIDAPAMTGTEEMDRAVRVQSNTLEQMVITLPAMWICAYFFMPLVAALLGLGFFIGRILYRNSYMKDPAKRTTGFAIGFLSNIGLIGCGLWGVVTSL